MTKTRPTLHIDVHQYQHYLDDADISDKDKKELLELLWDIICEFVQLSFNVHPLQQAQENCGQSHKEVLQTTINNSATLESSEHVTLAQNFIMACECEETLKREGKYI